MGREPFRDWSQFRRDFLTQFEPVSADAIARSQIRTHTQTGSVQAYIYRFRELMAQIPSINTSEAYDLFITGLKPELRQLVGTLVARDDLDGAINMAQRSHAYGSTATGRQDAAVRGKDNRQGKWQKGQANTVEQGKQTSGGDIGKGRVGSSEVNALEKAPKGNRRDYRGKGQGQGQSRGGRNQGRPQKPRTCFVCEKEGHFVRDCPELKELHKERNTPPKN